MTCVIFTLSLALWRFHKTDWKVLIASAVFPAVTMTVSFLLPWLVLKGNVKAAKAITVETSIQNLPTAVALIVTSYKGGVLAEMFPPLFFASVLGGVESILVLIIYRIVKYRRKRQLFPIQHDNRDDSQSSENEDND